MLEERDIQIRGYPVRLDLDLCLVFCANPEDYTNRGRIVTPLKDRIGCVIRTHYPLTREPSASPSPTKRLDRPRTGVQACWCRTFMKEILEEIARLARTSPAINQQSGVSVRMSIANLENMISNAERRGLLLGENPAVPRISDLAYLAASTRGKIELTLTEDEGPGGQGHRQTARRGGQECLREPISTSKQFRGLVEWFEAGKTLLTGDKLPAAEYVARAERDSGAEERGARNSCERPDLQPIRAKAEAALMASVAEFILEGLHVQNRLNKSAKGDETVYRR